jgi:DUF4097 and DUF4098 domain-containing protein YvlB
MEGNNQPATQPVQPPATDAPGKMGKVVVVVIVVAIVIGAAGFFFLTMIEDGDGMFTESYHDEFPTAPGFVLEVATVNGNIDIVTSTGDVIIVNGEKRADREQDLDNMELVVTETAGKLELEVVFDNQLNAEGDSFSLELIVPEYVAIENVQSVNGNLDVEATDDIQAVQTTNGNVRVEMSVINNNLNIDTVNGAVDVFVNPDLDLTIDISVVNGAITLTNLDLDLSDDMPNYKRGDLNGGGYEIYVDTTNGNVRFHTL